MITTSGVPTKWGHLPIGEQLVLMATQPVEVEELVEETPTNEPPA